MTLNNQQDFKLTYAKKLGRKYGLISAWICLLLGQFTMMFSFLSDSNFWAAVFWFVETGNTLGVIFGVVIIFIIGLFLGQIAAQLIIVRGYNSILSGIFYALALLLTVALSLGIYSVLRFGLRHFNARKTGTWFEYFFNTVSYTLLLGIIPFTLIGLWFSYQVKKGGKNIVHAQS